MISKAILHLDLDSFFVSVERKINSELNNKPVIVGGMGDRGVVASCSYETRKFGVRSGMPMKIARRLCPQAVYIKGNASIYTKESHLVTDIIKDQVPLFEKASVDEFYADLTGMDRFFGIEGFAKELRQHIIKESGLPISVGLSQNKVVSKIATSEIKPDAMSVIKHGEEKDFLAPLDVNKIPMIGNKTFQLLMGLGVYKVRTLQEMPVEVLEGVLGKNGRTIWKRANGIDHSPIVPFHDRKSISTERTFNRDTTDITRLHATLVAMTESLAYQLRRGNKLTSNISIKLRYSDFQTSTLQAKIPYTSADHILIPKAEELFKKLYNRRVLIRLIGVKLNGLVGGNYQINLFDDSEKMLSLYNSLDKIKNKYGERSVVRAVSMGAKTIGRMGNPFNGEPPVVLAHRKQ
ncbi:DNA polymerase IV [Zunongwangia endophytica]|uniref:DNA polymerase IV n=1 Tax=Zunongwangia endophytica TaxID=1808945 RepID=A0ABV8HDS9_9FLAO|nr:DNA polymerase IV [Zunongwangia endophytica]MDN3596319.1 DNA polymerase IV [Zunongwangia endophytica]